MELPNYQKKWESLNRAYQRLEEFYKGKIDRQDSFQGPKDFVYSYFHATYSLKEALKEWHGLAGIVESFITTEPVVALGIDISNKEKHGLLKNPKSNRTIGMVNSHIHIFDPQGKNRTELTIEIDGVKTDCLGLATDNLESWRDFLSNNNILII